MSIHFIASGYSRPRTGGEYHSFYIMKFLESRGKKINIIEADNVPRYIRKTHFLYNLYLIWYFYHLNDLMIIQTDYLHTRLVLFNVYLKLFKNVKLICISHHPFHFGITNPVLRYIDKAIEKIFYLQFERIVVISRSTKEEIIKFGISEEKIVIIPVGIDEDLMLMDSVHKSAVSRRIEILFVGNCEQRKGLEYLFDAVSRLNADYTVFIAGNDKCAPSYTTYLRRKIREYGIEDKVSFLNRIPADRLREQYRAADIFVLPSLWEGYGIVLMEAMAFGLPIVATRVGAIPEVVAEGENGLLVEPRDADGLSKALKALIEDPALRRRYGRASREIFRKKALSWDSVGEMFYQFIQSFKG